MALLYIHNNFHTGYMVTVNGLEEGVIVTREDKSGLRNEGTYKQSYITLR